MAFYNTDKGVNKMPYTIIKDGSQYCVHKKNEDGSAGERIHCHPTKQRAIAHLAALESNVDKSHVMFKTIGDQTYFIGVYSNRYKDREDEFLSEKSHVEYADWVNEKGVQPPVILFHQPEHEPGFWRSMVWIHEQGKIDTATFNKVMADFYKDYSFAVTERVMYVNGFTVVVAKVTKEKVANSLANDPVELGMSHGFVPLEFNDNIYDKYRSFEFSVLPKNRAANTYTQISFGGKSMNGKDREWVESHLGTETADELEEMTEKQAEELEQAGVEFKEAPEEESTEMDLDLVQVAKALKLDELVEVVRTQFANLDARLKEIEGRVENVEQTEDEKVAAKYDINWAKMFDVVSPSRSEKNVADKQDETEKAEKVFDFLSELSGGSLSLS